MSVTLSVEGFKPRDAKFAKMKKIHDACTEAGVDIPEEVEEYFGDGSPSDPGILVQLVDTKCCKELEVESEDGYEIDLSKLPADVKFIRFSVS